MYLLNIEVESTVDTSGAIFPFYLGKNFWAILSDFWITF